MLPMVVQPNVADLSVEEALAESDPLTEEEELHYIMGDALSRRVAKKLMLRDVTEATNKINIIYMVRKARGLENELRISRRGNVVYLIPR